MLLVTLLVLGGIVGYAHWRLHQLTGGAAAWATEVESSGTVLVAADRVYVFDERESVDIVDLEDGGLVHEWGSEPAGSERLVPTRMWLGEDGTFVVQGDITGPIEYAAYDRDGNPLWTRTEDDLARVSAIGEQGVTLTSCGERRCTVTTVDESGEELWSARPRVSTDPAAGSGSDWSRVGSQDDVLRPSNSAMVPTVPTVVRDGRVGVVDEEGRTVGGTIPFADSALAADLLVESSADEEGCSFRALRAGREVWSTTIDCGGRRFPGFAPRLVLQDRLYVGLERGGGDREGMVSLDLRTGDAAVLEDGWRAFTPESKGRVVAGDQVVVVQDEYSLTGHSPDTGEELWTRDGWPRSETYDGAARYPGVETAGGGVSVLHRHGGLWPALALGADAPRSQATILDARTGDTRGALVDSELYSARELPDGSAVVLAGGILRRIGLG